MDYTINEYPHLQFGSIYCIGRNYAKHIEEMKSKRTDDPVVFLKPRSSLVFNDQTIHLPQQSSTVHHEVELVLLIGRAVKNCSVKEALQTVQAVAVGIDVTARDIQSQAKKNGLPWTLSKGFDTFAPIGNFVELDSLSDIQNIDIQVRVNGELRQLGNTSKMLFSVSELISYLSHQFTLNPGDLIFTGTPEGVSPITDGDIIDASIGDQLSTLKVYVRT
ncbi:MAG: fumarylacetoacetate hydrolase family protein [Balneolaceae bacterium]|nr:fumarylacetoacetate hydrolase family protein [Balneolaceae bacterium]MDR9409492.1 fumarylacetoacetate hydrolase family protein [Balneolaceae bacterium]